MSSQICSVGLKNRNSRRFGAHWLLRRRHRGGAVALEFAILSIPFFMWILYIFELSYDLFTQQALDFALQGAVRQIQTGNAQNLASGGAFITSDFCGATKGLLECNQIWIRVQASPTYPATTLTGNPSTPVDYSALATGAIPMSGNHLNLDEYTSQGGLVPGNTQPVTPFCNAAPSQAVLVSAIYVGPSFISGMLPGVLSAQFNGTTVHATLSTAGFVTEPFTATPAAGGGGNGTTPAPSC
jgi:Flp pilus assembly protein TadG